MYKDTLDRVDPNGIDDRKWVYGILVDGNGPAPLTKPPKVWANLHDAVMEMYKYAEEEADATPGSYVVPRPNYPGDDHECTILDLCYTRADGKQRAYKTYSVESFLFA